VKKPIEASRGDEATVPLRIKLLLRLRPPVIAVRTLSMTADPAELEREPRVGRRARFDPENNSAMSLFAV
jgi:hypothetical protein